MRLDDGCGAARGVLDALHARYNRREFVSPDPLQFLYDYPERADREIAGLVASGLAYGRVAQILKSVGKILGRMGPSPREFVDTAKPAALKKEFRDFRHRFTTGDDVAALLTAAGRAAREHGSIEVCFAAGFSEGDADTLPAMSEFVRRMGFDGAERSYLLPSPERGSACKRLNLYLRWMVRADEVDPGGWTAVPPSALVVPLDTHMHRVCRELGMTRRAQADLRTAVEITGVFRLISPDDPVKYDFALTRMGIRPELDFADFLRECRVKSVA